MLPRLHAWVSAIPTLRHYNIFADMDSSREAGEHQLSFIEIIILINDMPEDIKMSMDITFYHYYTIRCFAITEIIWNARQKICQMKTRSD
jgi:hypothetical protein